MKKINATWPEMVKSLTVTLYNSVLRKLQGKRALARRARREHRLSLCKSCSSYCCGQKRCTTCGCFIKIKTWIFTAECPEGKWI